jgi:hypothetical protein
MKDVLMARTAVLIAILAVVAILAILGLRQNPAAAEPGSKDVKWP